MPGTDISIVLLVNSAPTLSLRFRISLPELFDLFAHFLRLGPGPHHLRFDRALVRTATNLEKAGIAPLGAPRVRGKLKEQKRFDAAFTHGVFRGGFRRGMSRLCNTKIIFSLIKRTF